MALAQAYIWPDKRALALAEVRKTLELNPRAPRNHISFTLLARANLNARLYESAVEWAQRALENLPGHATANYVMAASLGHLGRLEESRAALTACEQAQPGFVDKRRTWKPYSDPVNNEHILEGVRKAKGRESFDDLNHELPLGVTSRPTRR